MVKRLSAMQTWVRSLGWEDPLEKGMATHASILAWRIPWTDSSSSRSSVSMSEVVDISPGSRDSSMCFIQPGISHDVFCI